MGTRSMISQLQADGTYRAIYCHWDGNPAFNGKILIEHYSDPATLDALLALGALSSLGHEVGTQPIDRNDEENLRTNRQCVAHFRDMGRKWAEAKTLHFEEYEELKDEAYGCDAEYLYTWKKGQWWVEGRRFGGPWGDETTVEAAILQELRGIGQEGDGE